MFDGSGNLWVANDGPNTVVEYTPAQQTAAGAQTPNVLLTLPTSPFEADPWGLAFDTHGSLWISDADNDVVYEFTSAQIAATGTPVPTVTLNPNVAGGLTPQALLFDPHATAVGTAAARVGNHPSRAGGQGQDPFVAPGLASPVMT